MPVSPFHFEQLDRALDVLAQAAAAKDAGYLRILRIESNTSTPSVGRIGWSEMDLAAYMNEGEVDGLTVSMGVFDDPLDVGSDADTPENAQANTAVREERAKRIAEAAGRWVVDTVSAQMGRSEEAVLFALELRGPKGHDKLASPRFRCRRVKPEGSALDDGSGLAKALEPTIPIDFTTRNDIARSGAVADPDSRAWNTLSVAWDALVAGQMRSLSVIQNGYAHVHRVTSAALQDVRGSTGVLIREMSAQNARLQRECAAKDDLIRRMADELISFRIDLAGLGIKTFQAQDSAEVQKERLRVADSFVQSLGQLGQLYVAGKLDIEPELVDLLLLVRKRPKLLACLKNKKVQKALENDELVAGIIDTLEAVAAAMPDDNPDPNAPPSPEGAS